MTLQPLSEPPAPGGRSRGRPLPLSWAPWLLLAAACQSMDELGDQLPLDDRPGRLAEVSIQDASFVRFEGRRMSLDRFLYYVRRDARLATAQRIRAVQVLLPADVAIPADVTQRILTELKKAGVAEAELKTEGAG